MIATIFKKEINAFYTTPTAYIGIGLFLIIVWLFCWLLGSSSFINYGFAEMSSFFSVAPYVLLFLVPAITMRLIAEERANGTLELLFTKPITYGSIILGKYAASLLLIATALVLSFIFPYSLYQMGNPVGNLDLPGTCGSYLGLFLLGAVFCAVGLFCSSLTNNQILAFLLAFFINYILFDGLSRVADIEGLGGGMVYFLEQIGLNQHYNNLGRGVIALNDMVYFMNIILVFLGLTWYKLKSIIN